MSHHLFQIETIKRHLREEQSRAPGKSTPENLLELLETSGRVSENDTTTSSSVLSRRSLLGLSGVAVLGLAPSLKAIASTSLDDFRLERSDDSVKLFLGKKLCWEISEKTFGGSPILSVVSSESSHGIELSGSLFAGTDLTADFTCELTRKMTGWEMKLKPALARSSKKLPLEFFLAGFSVAEFSTTLRSISVGEETITFAKSPSLSVKPNWCWSFNNHDHELTFQNGMASGQLLQVSIPSPQDAFGHVESPRISLLRSVEPMLPTNSMLSFGELTLGLHTRTTSVSIESEQRNDRSFRSIPINRITRLSSLCSADFNQTLW